MAHAHLVVLIPPYLLIHFRGINPYAISSHDKVKVSESESSKNNLTTESKFQGYDRTLEQTSLL